MGETICLVFLLIPSIRVLWIFADWETLSGWVTPLGKPISQFRDSIAKKERKGKKKLLKIKQNKTNLIPLFMGTQPMPCSQPCTS